MKVNSSPGFTVFHVALSTVRMPALLVESFSKETHPSGEQV